MNFKQSIIVIATILLLNTPVLATGVDFNKQVLGIELIGLETLEPALSKKEKQHWLSTLKTQIGSRIKQENLQLDINELYLKGFFEAVTAETRPSRNGVILSFDLKRNPSITSIHLEPLTLGKKTRLLKRFKNKTGHTLNIKWLKDDITMLENYFQSRGYDLFKVVNASIEKDGQLTLKISEGRISNITWTGLKNIETRVASRTLASKAGGVFNSELLRKDRERLIRLGYFQSVSPPVLEESLDKQQVEVNFEVVEKKVNRIDTGLELDTLDDNVGVFFRGDLNHVLMHSDFFSGKIQVNFENGNAEIRTYSVHYSQPWFLNKWNVAFNTNAWLRFQQERISDTSNNDLYDNKRTGGDIGFTFPISGDQFTYTSRLKMEHIETTGTVPQNINLEPYTVQSLSNIFRFSTLKDRYRPRKGGYWTYKFEKGFDTGLMSISGLSFSRTTFNTAFFMPMTAKTVFGFRTFAGVFRPDASSNVVTFEQEAFELGGPNNLRGYRQDQAFVGFREILYNLEIRHDWSNTRQIVLFYDLGKTFNTGFDITQDLHYGYGLGIRFFTPIGPIRFDLAQGESDTILHFSLGQLF